MSGSVRISGRCLWDRAAEGHANQTGSRRFTVLTEGEGNGTNTTPGKRSAGPVCLRVWIRPNSTCLVC